MKKFVYLLLTVGILLLAVSEKMRHKAYRVFIVLKNGAERVVIRGDHLETRIIYGEAAFEKVKKEPGRLVIIAFESDLSSVSRVQSTGFDEKLRALPAKVLLARVQQERNEKLMESQGLKSLPTLRIYREGKLLREFSGPIDEAAFFSYINGQLENWSEKS